MRGLTDEERDALSRHRQTEDVRFYNVAMGLVERGLMTVIWSDPVLVGGSLETYVDFSKTDLGRLALRVDEAARKAGVR